MKEETTGITPDATDHETTINQQIRKPKNINF